MGRGAPKLKVDFRFCAEHPLRMLATVLPFPNIGPEIFSIDLGGFHLALRWYALAYIAGILIGWRLILRSLKTPRLWPADTPPMTADQLEALMTWIIVGIIAGGRLGFVVFYQPGYYLANPLEIPDGLAGRDVISWRISGRGSDGLVVRAPPSTAGRLGR